MCCGVERHLSILLLLRRAVISKLECMWLICMYLERKAGLSAYSLSFGMVICETGRLESSQ